MTEHVNVRGLKLADRDLVEAGQAGGFTFWWNDTQRYIVFKCPCGCSRVFDLPIREPHTVHQRGWIWDQVGDEPTLTPSIRQLGGCYWHGHLVKGEWRPEPDSGVKA